MDPDAPDRYGRSFADVYDDWYAHSFDTDGAVRTLLELAHDGPVLELGVGTGRLAAPIARAGVEVVGIDASTEMIERAPTLANLRYVVGDMRAVDIALERLDPALRFRLAYCAFNTIFNLTGVDAIDDCLRATRTLLRDDGRLVLEGIVPTEPSLIPTTSLTPARVTSSDPVFVETRYDRTTGVLHGRHLQVTATSVRSRPWSVLLLPPERLIDLAIGAGFGVEHLWADWEGRDLDDDASSFVVVLRTLSS